MAYKAHKDFFKKMERDREHELRFAKRFSRARNSYTLFFSDLRCLLPKTKEELAKEKAERVVKSFLPKIAPPKAKKASTVRRHQELLAHK